MYYRLNLLGRSLWNLTAFLSWAGLTVWTMRSMMRYALDVGARNYEFARQAGFNPAVGDLGNLFLAAVVFFIIPLACTAAVVIVNNLLKGKVPHEPAREIERPLLPPPPGSL